MAISKYCKGCSKQYYCDSESPFNDDRSCPCSLCVVKVMCRDQVNCSDWVIWFDKVLQPYWRNRGKYERYM